MTSRDYPKSPLIGACTAIWRHDKILLARRGRAPNINTWAMPGGLVEVGESLKEAAIREVWEETALKISNPVFNRFHEIIVDDDCGRTQRHFVLAMFVATSPSGEAIAGDDAKEVRWFDEAEMLQLSLTGETITLVRESKAFL